MKKIMSMCFVFVSALLFIGHAANAKTITIPVYSYYTAPPFHFIEKNTGLVKDVLRAIDEASASVKFDYHIVSRPKVSAMLDGEQKMFIIPFAHPIWFKDKKKKKYLWSRPLFTDFDALISHIDHSIEFKGLHTFMSQKVGVPKGFSIYLLDDLVEKKQAEKVDVASIPALIRLVEHKTIKMAVVPYAVAQFHTDKAGIKNLIYFSKRPQQTYERHLMLVNSNVEIRNAIDEAIRLIRKNGTLDGILKKYGY